MPLCKSSFSIMYNNKTKTTMLLYKTQQLESVQKVTALTRYTKAAKI